MKFTDLFKQNGRERGVESSAEVMRHPDSVVPELAAYGVPKDLVPKVKERVHKEIGEAEKLPMGKDELGNTC